MPRVIPKKKTLVPPPDFPDDMVTAITTVQAPGRFIQKGDWLRRDDPVVISAPDCFRYAPRQLTKENSNGN